MNSSFEAFRMDESSLCFSDQNENLIVWIKAKKNKKIDLKQCYFDMKSKLMELLEIYLDINYTGSTTQGSFVINAKSNTIQTIINLFYKNKFPKFDNFIIVDMAMATVNENNDLNEKNRDLRLMRLFTLRYKKVNFDESELEIINDNRKSIFERISNFFTDLFINNKQKKKYILKPRI